VAESNGLLNRRMKSGIWIRNSVQPQRVTTQKGLQKSGKNGIKNGHFLRRIASFCDKPGKNLANDLARYIAMACFLPVAVRAALTTWNVGHAWTVRLRVVPGVGLSFGAHGDGRKVVPVDHAASHDSVQ